jgi:hypothetical protein
VGRRARSTGSRRRGSLLRSRCTELYYSHEHTRRPRANRELVERSQVRLLFLFSSFVLSKWEYRVRMLRQRSSPQVAQL